MNKDGMVMAKMKELLEAADQVEGEKQIFSRQGNALHMFMTDGTDASSFCPHCYFKDGGVPGLRKFVSGLRRLFSVDEVVIHVLETAADFQIREVLDYDDRGDDWKLGWLDEQARIMKVRDACILLPVIPGLSYVIEPDQAPA